MRNAPPRRRRGAARAAIWAALLVSSSAIAGAPAQAEPHGEGTVVYERPADGPRRGVLTVPAFVVYGAASVALLAAAAHLVARARRRP